MPQSLIPTAYAHLPVLGFVRNPWSYYVSWYAFQAGRPRPNPLFRVLSNEGQLDFAATLRNMLDLGTSGEYLEALIAALPKGYRNRGLNLPGFELAAIARSGLGFYSFLHRHVYGGAGVRHIGQMEHLREELASMLVGVGQPVSAAMRAYLHDAPAQNVSEHKPYAQYYSAELRELVAQRDAEVIERYGYRCEV